jgi:F-type H+-transporting ATPase subunit b
MRLRLPFDREKARFLSGVFLPLALAMWLLVLSAASAIAQDMSPSSPAENRSAVSAQPAGSAGGTESPKEAAGDDEQAQFKHSAAVRYIAGKTGMSLDHAYWLGVLLNFAIVLGIIVWLSRKHLPEAFRNRTLSIQKAMQEARKASEEASRRLAEIELRLSRLDAEIAGMQAKAEKEALAEEARIQAAAEQDTRRIVESAEQEIVAAAKSVRRELTAYAADLAVSLAKQRIQVDPPTDQALVRGFAQQLTRKDQQ